MWYTQVVVNSNLKLLKLRISFLLIVASDQKAFYGVFDASRASFNVDSDPTDRSGGCE